MISAIIAAIAPHLISMIFDDDKKEGTEAGGLKDDILAALTDVLGAKDMTDEAAALAALRADPEKFMRVQERLTVIEAQHTAREAKSMAEARAGILQLSKLMRGMAFIPAFLAVISLAALMYVVHRILTAPAESELGTMYGVLGFVAPLTYAAFNHILGSSIGSKLKTGIAGGLGRR